MKFKNSKIKFYVVVVLPIVYGGHSTGVAIQNGSSNNPFGFLNTFTATPKILTVPWTSEPVVIFQTRTKLPF